MSAMQKGFLALVAWLMLGFVFTELTVLALNAWTLHETQRHERISLASPSPLPIPE